MPQLGWRQCLENSQRAQPEGQVLQRFYLRVWEEKPNSFGSLSKSRVTFSDSPQNGHKRRKDKK